MMKCPSMQDALSASLLSTTPKIGMVLVSSSTQFLSNTPKNVVKLLALALTNLVFDLANLDTT